jgi:hypothetical protein
MPTLRSYQSGVSVFMGGTHVYNAEQKTRGDVVGWSAAAARRNTRFLWTVDPLGLHGAGYALTLTMRDTPPTAEEFGRMRAALFERWRRAGMVRAHWVVEWQRRGTPHLHAAVYLPRSVSGQTEALPQAGPPAVADTRLVDGAKLVVDWLDIAGEFGAEWQSQDCKPIFSELGWLEYLAKHASRGAMHYQRQAGMIPEGWKKSGRLWGHLGEWPTVEPVDIPDLTARDFYLVRRIIDRWSLAQARSIEDPQLRAKKIRFLKRRRSSGDAKHSRRRGVSEWFPESELLRLVDFLENRY